MKVKATLWSWLRQLAGLDLPCAIEKEVEE